MRKLLEKDVQRAIIEALNYTGKCMVWRNNAGMIPVESKKYGKRMVKLGEKGQADIMGIRKPDGKFIAIEVKTPARKKYVSEYQELFLQDIRDHGGLAGVATSVEEALETVIKK